MTIESLLAPSLARVGDGFALDTALPSACAHAVGSRGKYLRPKLVVTAAEAFGGAERELLGKAAAAVELLHLSSLAHDDVLDDADARRDAPSTGAAYGPTAAVLAGGWLFAAALELAGELGARAYSDIAEAAERMCDGQLLEVQDLYDSGRTHERYIDAAGGKTAALFAVSAQLGAGLAGAPAEAVARLREFGHELGVLFQMVDDILDLLAGEELTGKPPGADIRHGVYTLPIVDALARSPELARMLSRPLGAEDLEQARRLILDTGAVDRAFEELDERGRRAREAVSGMPNEDELVALVDDVLERAETGAADARHATSR